MNWTAFGALLVMCLLCNCQSLLPTHVAHLPSEIPYGSCPLAVKLKMGPPQSTEDWLAGDACTLVGEIWHYEDEWHTQPGWYGWQDNFSSWDLYFDSRQRFVGWKLVEPLSSQGRAREHFAIDKIWKKEAKRLITDFLDAKAVRYSQRRQPKLNSRMLKEHCALLAAGLKGYPLNVRHSTRARQLAALCESVPRKGISQQSIDNIVGLAENLKQDL